MHLEMLNQPLALARNLRASTLVLRSLNLLKAASCFTGTLDAINALREGAAGAARRAVDTVRVSSRGFPTRALHH